MKRFAGRAARKIRSLATTNRLALAVDRHRRIFRLRQQIQMNESIRLIVGASGTRQSGWVPMEQDELNLLDRSSWQRLVERGTVSAINAEHVWEHLEPAHAVSAAKLCFEFLKPGGYVRCAVPDGLHPSSQYIEWVRPGGSGPGSDDHRVLYNFRSLSEVFRSAGFEIELLEYYDTEGVFHAVPWDPERGMVSRSIRFDAQDRGTAFVYTSLIVDAVKPAAEMDI